MLCYKSRHNSRLNKSSTWMDLSYSFEFCLSIYTVNYIKLQYCYFASMTSVKSHHSKSDIAPLIKRNVKYSKLISDKKLRKMLIFKITAES